jgi:VanZ family protein
MPSALRFWKLVALWAVTIFGLSSIPGRAFPSLPIFSYDKFLHAGVYAVLGGLCFFALQKTSGLRTSRLIALSMALAFLYGVTDEIHQLFVPGRSADPYDAAADGIGGLAGALAAAVVSSFAKGRADAAS